MIPHDINISHITGVRIMMLEIRNRIDEYVEINESTVKSLYLNLLTDNYGTIMMYHGEDFINQILAMFEECELYETCILIRDQIISTKLIINSTP